MTQIYKPDVEVEQYVKEMMEKHEKGMNDQIGYIGVTLEGNCEDLRSKETITGNFIADLVRTEYHTNFCLIGSGSIRLSSDILKGSITKKTAVSISPFPD